MPPEFTGRTCRSIVVVNVVVGVAAEPEPESVELVVVVVVIVAILGVVDVDLGEYSAALSPAIVVVEDGSGDEGEDSGDDSGGGFGYGGTLSLGIVTGSLRIVGPIIPMGTRPGVVRVRDLAVVDITLVWMVWLWATDDGSIGGPSYSLQGGHEELAAVAASLGTDHTVTVVAEIMVFTDVMFAHVANAGAAPVLEFLRVGLVSRGPLVMIGIGLSRGMCACMEAVQLTDQDFERAAFAVGLDSVVRLAAAGWSLEGFDSPRVKACAKRMRVKNMGGILCVFSTIGM